MVTASGKKVAIVHDWLVGGGAERVVLELHKLFPEAPIYTSYCTPEWRQTLDNKVVTGYLQRWPFGPMRKYLPLLRSHWFRSLDLSLFDIVISSTGNGEAKQVRVPQNTKHICYCHSPTHFYWRHYNQYRKNPGFGIFNPFARLGLRILIGPLRKRDYQAAQKVDQFMANSTHIQKDIKKFYGRDSTVVHPPVNTKSFAEHASKTRSGLVTVGRQTPYKHTEFIVQACTQLNLPLLCIGNGPEHQKLSLMAGPSVRFATDYSDEQVAQAVGSAEAFLFAAEEDFGVAPVEALAAGTPIIAYKAGGALDYVQDGKNGLFFEQQSVDSVKKAIKRFRLSTFNSQSIIKSSTKFSVISFKTKISQLIR